MGKSTTGLRVLPSPEDIRQLLRAKVVAAVQEVLEEEIALLLGSERYERTETRNGYRNGGERRRVTTERGIESLQERDLAGGAADQGLLRELVDAGPGGGLLCGSLP
jgi:hypothetical protein